MDAWICPVCYREHISSDQRYVIQNCGHQYCARCLAEHVWRQQSHPRPACPICRQPMLLCGPGSSSTSSDRGSQLADARDCARPAAAPPAASGSAPGGALLPLQIGRVRFELQLSDPRVVGAGRVREAICTLFRLDPGRLKLVSRGRCLESEEELRAAAASRAAVVVVASRGKAPSWAARRAQQLLGAVHRLLSSWLRRLAATAAARRLRGMWQPLAETLRVFAASLHPSFAAPAPTRAALSGGVAADTVPGSEPHPQPQPPGAGPARGRRAD
ncbi:tripartite [Pleodorina starrii]|uniref:Tripartite n=1 Tax=Pleodorina starrii TaxID=330485 RepID=A0A9W6F521_9CHLO|nr:tripartite [Pleodorina starrii]GLC56085.1 tripartite [Pleodorina starrii]GLC64069.1 tripartite [Pleodorina starrii]